MNKPRGRADAPVSVNARVPNHPANVADRGVATQSARFSSLAALLTACETRLKVMPRSARTVEAYSLWIRRFVAESGRKNPELMGRGEVETFLSKLATERNVSASSQNQALCALLFLYKHVLGAPLEHMPELVRARRPENLPVVLSRNEAHRVLQAMSGTKRLMAALLYGGGLRLSECCALRVQDIDFERKQVCVRRGKGRKDRMTLLPANLVKPLQQHLVSVQRQHHADLKADAGHVELPEALARKSPTASLSWSWQWVFPATQVSTRRDRPTATAPLARNCAAEGRTDGDVQSWHQQARQLPLVSPLVCDGATHGGLRHPNDSEVARTQHQTNRLPRLCWLRMNGHNTRSSSIRARGQPQ